MAGVASARLRRVLGHITAGQDALAPELSPLGACPTAGSGKVLQNLIGGAWEASSGKRCMTVIDPADGLAIAECPLSEASDVDRAVQAAAAAFPEWSATTVKSRAQILFKFKQLLEEHASEIADLIVKEHGKCKPEAMASLAKGIETVEYACSLPVLLPGRILEVSAGVECREYRDPIGVVASVVPFNFPAMVPLWTIPIAIGCGNCMVFKPSEKVPLTVLRMAELLHEAGLPKGVFNVVLGDRVVAEALCDHPGITAFTFVGSSPVAKALHLRATQAGKRAICLGGAKNHLVALEDCVVDMAASDICASFAGSAGQRCMAASVLLLVGQQQALLDAVVEKARTMQPGQAEMGQIGPVVDQAALDRITRYVTEAEKSGAQILLDGRAWAGKAKAGAGFWFGPTIILHSSPDCAAMQEEIFGPVLSVCRVSSADEALKIENRSPYGNAACVYTSTGEHADFFTKRFRSAMIGVNIGIPVPREPFSFGGMNASKYGGPMDLTGDGGVEFFTLRRKVTSKWAPSKDRSLVSRAFIN